MPFGVVVAEGKVVYRRKERNVGGRDVRRMDNWTIK